MHFSTCIVELLNSTIMPDPFLFRELYTAFIIKYIFLAVYNYKQNAIKVVVKFIYKKTLAAIK